MGWLFSCSGNSIVDWDYEMMAECQPLSWDADDLAFACAMIEETDELIRDGFASLDFLNAQPDLLQALQRNVHRTISAVNAGNGDHYELGLDNLRIIVNELVYPPTATPTATPTFTPTATGTPDPCTFRPDDSDELLNAVNAGNVNGPIPTRICLTDFQEYRLDNDHILPPITGKITIEGNGARISRYEQDDVGNPVAPFRIFQVEAGGELTLQDVTLYGGYAETDSGGALYNAGTTLIESSGLEYSQADVEGGGIYNSGSLTLDNTRLEGNFAAAGGAIANRGDLIIQNESLMLYNNSSGPGAALANWGTANIANSTFQGNHSNDSGGAIFNDGALDMISTTLIQNQASFAGGGLRNDPAGQVTILDSDISDNTAGWAGGIDTYIGSVSIENSRLIRNIAGWAGAVDNYFGTVSITGSVLEDNEAYANFGGAVLSNATTTIADSCIVNNTSANGSEVHNEGGSALDATNNWWGTSNGPSGQGTGSGDSVSSNVTFAPWLATPPAELGCQGVVVSGNVIQVDGTEPETALALFSVNTLDDGPTTSNGICSLREAIESANNGGRLPENPFGNGDPNPTDCIATGEDSSIPNGHVAVDLASATYLITHNVPFQPITGGVHVRVPNGYATIKRADISEDIRLFNVEAGGTLVLNNVIITNGRVQGNGGAIHNAGTLVLRNSAVIGNFASGNGGGIYNTAELIIENSRIEGNESSGGNGGGIFSASSGPVTISGSCIVANLSSAGRGIFAASGSSVNVPGNWWGLASGPSNDDVSGDVSYTPWLETPPPGLNCINLAVDYL